MKRRLSNLLTALSLLLLAAVCALWVRGRRGIADVIHYDTRGRHAQVGSAGGGLALIVVSAPFGKPTAAGFEYRCERSNPFLLFRLLASQDYPNYADSVLFRMGFGPFRAHPGPTAFVPCWSAALPLAVLPLWRSSRAVATRRHRDRTRRGLCRRCGYDLRATPERCPECGNAAFTTGRSAG
jgi:hypothetical protein